MIRGAFPMFLIRGAFPMFRRYENIRGKPTMVDPAHDSA